MSDCVNYVIETSNDDFLEAIEAISRSHRDYVLDIETSSSTEFCKPNFLNLESDELKLIHRTYSAALKDDDCHNPTDCDFNFMVDPRTGRRSFDEESYLDEFESSCVDEGTNDQLNSSNFNTEDKHVKVESIGNHDDKSDVKPLNTLSSDNQSSSKGNKVVFVKIANSPSNSEKNKKTENLISNTITSQEKFGKPPFSYSCLIAMALKNSESGYLPVSEIYSYIVEKFPYFKKAPDGWKNSIRHNLSLNKCFQKLETPLTNGTSRKACLWGLNETKLKRLDEVISKWIVIEPEYADTLRFDTREPEETAHESGKNSSETVDQHCKEIKEMANGKQIKTEPLLEVSPDENLLTDSDEQAWDDFEIEKLKPAAPYFYFTSDNSQPAFDSALSFKAVRASA